MGFEYRGSYPGFSWPGVDPAGLNVLAGSVMSGKPLYTVLGLVLDVVGIVLLYFANRRRAKMG